MDTTKTADPYELARAEVMLIGYDTRWLPEMEHYEVLGVESEFYTALMNPETGAPSRTWRLGGKLDGIVRDLTTGRVLVLEHKTTTEDPSPGSDYVKRLRMDGQVSVYYVGGRALGFDIEGVLYDVLGKPKQRPLKATPRESRKYKADGSLYANQRDTDETPAEYRARVAEAVAADPNAYFTRSEVVRLESEVHEAMADAWQLGRAIRENHLAGRAPRNPDACVRYGRTCEFFGVCTGEASIEDPALFRRSEHVHPELAGGDAAVLSASRLSAARACARLEHLHYRLGYRPAAEADTLRFGHLIHKGLEAWWLAKSDRLGAALAALSPAAPAPEASAA